MAEMKRISSEEIKVLRSDDSKDVIVEGYAAVFNQRSALLAENGKMIYESIKPYAFSEAIESLSDQKVDCVATYEHDRKTMLARTKSGTLTLWEDSYGLKFRFTIPNTTYGNDVKEQLSRGDLSQCSFIAFSKRGQYSETRNTDGTIERIIEKFYRLKDVSLVIDPVYDGTHAEEIKRSIEEFEKIESDEALEVQRKLDEEKIAAKKAEDDAADAAEIERGEKQAKIDLDLLNLTITIN